MELRWPVLKSIGLCRGPRVRSHIPDPLVGEAIFGRLRCRHGPDAVNPDRNIPMRNIAEATVQASVPTCRAEPLEYDRKPTG